MPGCFTVTNTSCLHLRWSVPLKELMKLHALFVAMNCFNVF